MSKILETNHVKEKRTAERKEPGFVQKALTLALLFSYVIVNT